MKMAKSMQPNKFWKQAQRGMTLLEVIISLAIISSALIGLAVIADRYSSDTKLTIAASQERAFGEAVKAYIKDNYAAVQAVATATTPAMIDVPTLIAAGNLTTGFLAANAYGQSMCALVLEPTANRLQAMVVAEGGQTIDDLSLGSLVAMIGGSGGAVYASDPTIIRGAIGGWSITTVTFDNLTNNVNRKCDGTVGNVRLVAGRPVMSLWFENGDTSAAFLSRDLVPGRPELNAMNTPIVMNSVQTATTACTLLGAIARDASGAVLSCNGTTWRTQGSVFWQDAVATYAALPACVAAISGQTRVVTTPTIGTGPRAYACDGTAWKALAVDNNGDLTITGTVTTGKIQVNDVVTEGSGSGCTSNGLVARDSTGLLLSCQSGVWRRGGMKISSTTLTTTIPSNQNISGACWATGASITVATPGFYGIHVDAGAYLYSGSFNNLGVHLYDSSDTINYCSGTATLTQNALGGYMIPSAYCIEHLNAGIYHLKVSGSNANDCATSSISTIFGATAKLRLLSED
jgi:prepilin-type N-terminal cleavage/methylation domain-containing protein